MSANDTALVPGPHLNVATQIVNAIATQHGSGPYALETVNKMCDVLTPAYILTYPELGDSDAVLIRKLVLQLVLVDVEDDLEHVSAEHQPWLNEAVAEGTIDLKRWYFYKQFLANQGYAPQVLQSMDTSTQEVADFLGDPRVTDTWRRRGLVIGDVQSGKTATYIGILNKAADAGFKLIVLLAGGTESLRKQTQSRVDEGLIGKDSTVTKGTQAIGVGHYKVPGIPVLGQSMTSHAHDFNKAAATSGTQSIDPNDPVPMIFVIKKNKTALENVLTWYRLQKHRDVPMLVVDDESDYASVNTKHGKNDDDDPTLINKRIRELLALAPRSSYLAFTATPFANVFIDHKTNADALKDDLFPHDYICALPTPTNYMGSDRYFGTSDSPDDSRLVFIEDAEPHVPVKHKSTDAVVEIPDSLTSAIRTFVLAAAIREHRSDHRSRSMLINVSRFKRIQEQVHELVLGTFERIKAAVELHSAGRPPSDEAHPELVALKGEFESHFSSADLTWEEVRARLLAGVLDTSVQLVNSDRKIDEAETTKHSIVVGGNVLSRGLTLEGLTVSYYYRVVGAADTLLQMARWFGYRPGYDDLVRVWISSEAADQFRYVAEVIAELRSQLRQMRSAGMTPRHFGLAVRRHPETLRVTAANKLGGAEVRAFRISVAGRRIESTSLPADPNVIASNHEHTLKMLQSLDSVGPAMDWTVPGMSYPGRINVDRVLVADFLESFGSASTDHILGGSFLANAIRSSTSSKFQNWTVGIVTGSGQSIDLPGAGSIATVRRAVRYRSGDVPTFRVSGKSARLAGSTDLANTFSSAGEKLTEVTGSKGTAESVYAVLPHPTLLIYFIEPNLVVKPSDGTGISSAMADRLTAEASAAWNAVADLGLKTIVAVKVAIQGQPGSEGGDVEYLVNSAWNHKLFGEPTLTSSDEEDLDG